MPNNTTDKLPSELPEALKTRLQSMQKNLVWIVIAMIAVIMFFSFIGSFYFQTEVGYTYHYQNTMTGGTAVYTEPGLHAKVPMFSRVTPYKQVVTVAFGNEDISQHKLTRRNAEFNVLFADTYRANISATFRFKLPIIDESMENIHRDFRSFDNLVDALLVRTARDVVINTATQYTGEEFFQGALNQFKAALSDQLRYGIYKTERKQVEIEETSLAPVGLGQEDSTQLRKTRTLVWKTVPVLDESGQFVRQENPLDMYGIEVTQVTIGSTKPEPQLESLLSEKKRLVAERIKTVQEQETAKEQAKTAQLRADIERTKAKQEALKQKELAVIAKQREVEEAQKQAEKEVVEYEKIKELALIEKAKELEIAEANRKRAVIEKTKELEVAQANRDIQKANYEAAQFEAKAKLELGEAEAKVLEAKYAALKPDIYLAELQRDIARVLYSNLEGFEITMPHNVVNLGEASGESQSPLHTNLDVLASFAAISTMQALQQQAAPLSADGAAQPATAAPNHNLLPPNIGTTQR